MTKRHIANVPYRNGIDVTGVALESLLALAIPDVPQLGKGVTGPRDEWVLVRRECQAHAVSHMVQELHLLFASLQIPKTTGQE